MKRHEKSHLDHGLTAAQIDHIFKLYGDREDSFFLEQITLPPELGTVPCGLWGPLMGDPAILNGGEVVPLPEGEYITPSLALVSTFNGAITLSRRSSDRAWDSRLINLPMRPTRIVTVIGGASDAGDCILYTAYGGPAAPREPGDPSIAGSPDALKESIDFWVQHALSMWA